MVFAVHLGAWRSGGYGAQCCVLCGMLETGARASHRCTACAAGRSVNMLVQVQPLPPVWLIPALPACLWPLPTPSAGDIIDFHNSLLPDCPDSGLPASEKALREVLQHFDRLERPTLHLLG